MKTFYLSLTFILTTSHVFSQVTESVTLNSNSTSNKKKTIISEPKNSIKLFVFSIGSPGFSAFALGYERNIVRNSIELIISLRGEDGDNESGTLSVHTGYKFHFNNESPKNQPYITLFFRYDSKYVYIDQDEQGEYRFKAYDFGVGVGNNFMIKKWLFIESGLFGFYSFVGKEKYSGTKSKFESGPAFLPRLLIGFYF